MIFTFFLIGCLLGLGIGSLGMWIYLMNKYAGRPVDWSGIWSGLWMTCGAFAVLGLFHLVH